MGKREEAFSLYKNKSGTGNIGAREVVFPRGRSVPNSPEIIYANNNIQTLNLYLNIYIHICIIYVYICMYHVIKIVFKDVMSLKESKEGYWGGLDWRKTKG